jgi:glycosyltransferase involved in cell wall biosynthesis
MTLPVSVIIPAYNAEAVLGRALETVLGQSAPPAQVIVVDDGSADGTWRILQGYGKAVTAVRQENAGVSAARNRGIAAATAEWVAFLDADDEWLPGKLERQWTLLRRHPELPWCAENLDIVRDGKQVAVVVPPPLRGEMARDDAVPFFDAARQGLWLQTSGFLIHRRLLDEAGPFDPSLRVAEDRDMWWRIALRHPRIGYCLEPGHRYHLDNPGSLMKTSRDRSPSLRVVCETLRRARAQGPEAVDAYLLLGRPIAFDYLLRYARNDIVVDPELVRAAEELFPPTPLLRVVRACQRHLPLSIARRAAGMVTHGANL